MDSGTSEVFLNEAIFEAMVQLLQEYFMVSLVAVVHHLLYVVSQLIDCSRLYSNTATTMLNARGISLTLSSVFQLCAML